MSPYHILFTPDARSNPATSTALTRDQVREVDRIAIQQLSIPGIVLMENAGLNATDALLDHVQQTRSLNAEHVHAVVLCGGGNNGGDGYVIARQLHNRGAKGTLIALKPPGELSGDAAVNHQICARMDLPIGVAQTTADVTEAAKSWTNANVFVDALLGTGFHGEVREPMATAIQTMNRIRSESNDRATVLAVDVPSGLDCEQGRATNATVQADLTVTFVAAKTVLLTEQARPYVGTLAVADIGAPPALIERVRRQT